MGCNVMRCNVMWWEKRVQDEEKKRRGREEEGGRERQEFKLSREEDSSVSQSHNTYTSMRLTQFNAHDRMREIEYI